MIAILTLLLTACLVLALLHASSGRLCRAEWVTSTLVHHCGQPATHTGAHVCGCGRRHTNTEGVSL